ncbi:unnamed protein product [Leptidea sinapis]|uniref:Uncharacterized protein n=1 Tax=Leptidea sinapis TaxID=189913 RepID=A0A5E4Q3S5_9NEOP|nr:unnamed protein product [Leptidea sinapis]
MKLVCSLLIFSVAFDFDCSGNPIHEQERIKVKILDEPDFVSLFRDVKHSNSSVSRVRSRLDEDHKKLESFKKLIPVLEGIPWVFIADKVEELIKNRVHEDGKGRI